MIPVEGTYPSETYLCTRTLRTYNPLNFGARNAFQVSLVEIQNTGATGCPPVQSSVSGCGSHPITRVDSSWSCIDSYRSEIVAADIELWRILSVRRCFRKYVSLGAFLCSSKVVSVHRRSGLPWWRKSIQDVWQTGAASPGDVSFWNNCIKFVHSVSSLHKPRKTKKRRKALARPLAFL